MKPDDRSHLEEFSRLNNEFANLQREMAKKNVELAKLSELKNRMIGVVAHDLRSPLGVILGYAECLESDTADPLSAEHRHFVATIRKSSEFMLRLVTDLLDVTAIEAGKLTLDRQPTDLGRLTRDNVVLNAVLASRKEITLILEPYTAIPEAALDRGKIEQVLNNLIGNAVKFSHRGRTVRVTITPDAAEGYVTVAVEDEGQGIPEADLAKLFKPFGKTSVRATSGEQSTGLGLAIVRNIVEGHGGRITVTSKVGAGSRFAFTLPMPVAAGPAPSLVMPANARILVADDNAVNQKIAVIQLQKLGLQADVVGTGRDALDAVARERYDLVLMDCEMPDLDGFEATRAIREAEAGGRRIPIVAMTANAGAEDRQRCLDAGMDDYLTKPRPSNRSPG
ncbi:MAG: ATP-binding protein [Acidobacteriota bacterium]|nr:ATP-binding protein [Acidobacteriota bacterium]